MSFRVQTNAMSNEESYPSIGYHNCTLFATHDHTMSFGFAGSIWNQTKRVLRRLTLPTYKHSKTKYFFKSYLKLSKEWDRTLRKNNPIIIHPFSFISMMRDIIMCFLWTFLLYYRPFVVLVVVMSNGNYSVVDKAFLVLITSSFLVANVYLNTITGFLSNNGEIILDRSKILKNYLKTYLIIDILDCFPLAFLFSIFKHDPWIYTSLAALHLTQLARLKTMVDYYQTMVHAFKIPPLWGEIGMLLIIFSISLYWSTCVVLIWSQINYLTYKHYNDNENANRSMIYMLDLQEKSAYFAFPVCLRLICVHFFFCGGGLRTYLTDETILLTIACIWGYVIKVTIMVFLFSKFWNFKKTDQRFQMFYKSQVKYVHSRNLPSNLKNKIFTYFRFKYSKTYFDVTQIQDSLSIHLSHEMYLSILSHMLVNVEIFRGLYQGMIGDIIMDFEPRIYLPGDVFFKADEPFAQLFIISYGRAAIYTNEGMEVLHFNDGALLGIGGLGMGYHTWNMVAVDATEAMVWSKEDVERMMERYPAIETKLQEAFENRVEDVFVYAREKRLQQVCTAKMQSLLGKKKILEQKVLRLYEEDL